MTESRRVDWGPGPIKRPGPADPPAETPKREVNRDEQQTEIDRVKDERDRCLMVLREFRLLAEQRPVDIDEIDHILKRHKLGPEPCPHCNGTGKLLYTC